MPNPGWHPGPAFLVLAPLLGISRLLPPPTGAGEERRRRGRGGGERRAVYDEMPAECMFGTGTPGLRPLPALATRTPAPAREPYRRASMVLFAGEGVPSPGPSPGDIPHGTVGGMVWGSAYSGSPPQAGFSGDTSTIRRMGWLRHPGPAPRPRPARPLATVAPTPGGSSTGVAHSRMFCFTGCGPGRALALAPL